MAITTCVVSGTVKTLGNAGLTPVTVRASIPKPFKHPSDGSVIANYEVSTTTDVDGNWSLTLIETTTPAISVVITFDYSTGFEQRRKEYTITVPNQATANFTDLTGSQL